MLLMLLLLLQLALYRWFSSQIRAVQRGTGEDLGGFAVVLLIRLGSSVRTLAVIGYLRTCCGCSCWCCWCWCWCWC